MNIIIRNGSCEEEYYNVETILMNNFMIEIIYANNTHESIAREKCTEIIAKPNYYGTVDFTVPNESNLKNMNKIKSLRIEKGFKVGEFAKELGISREYLRLIENGTAKNPNRDLMKKIAKLLNSDVMTLFFS